jgi:hypothetical protein
MANCESIIWISINLLVLGILGVENFLSKQIFFLGTKGNTILGDVLEIVGLWIFNFGLTEISEAKGGAGFAEGVHFFMFNIK